jgi:ABC-2 type transport system ATP-binding protein
MADLIVASGLEKHFGSGSSAIWAVRGIDLVVPAGQVLGFLGPNGAGKSTTMRMLTGFLEPSAGSAQICGIDMSARPIEAKRHIGYLPEGAPAYPDMTVEEFLGFVAEARGFARSLRRERVERVMGLVHLEGVRRQTIETLSKGYKRRTGLAQALLHDPSVLILDEPTDGLDPNQKHEVRQLIRTLGGERAIVLSTHILEEVEAVCTRAVVINRGRIVFDGTPSAMETMAPASVTRNRLDWVFRSLTSSDVAASGAAA